MSVLLTSSMISLLRDCMNESFLQIHEEKQQEIRNMDRLNHPSVMNEIETPERYVCGIMMTEEKHIWRGYIFPPEGHTALEIDTARLSMLAPIGTDLIKTEDGKGYYFEYDNDTIYGNIEGTRQLMEHTWFITFEDIERELKKLSEMMGEIEMQMMVLRGDVGIPL